MIPPCFIGQLSWRCPPDDDAVMVLTTPLTFVDPRGRWWRAPRGLVSDGVSVGQLLRIPVLGWLVARTIGGTPFTGPFRWAAVLHDAAYGSATAMSLWQAFRSPERAAADRLMREAAQCATVCGRPDRHAAPAWRAWVVWAALRIGGAKAWKDDGSEAQRSLARL